jgi:hypothetical protein
MADYFSSTISLEQPTHENVSTFTQTRKNKKNFRRCRNKDAICDQIYGIKFYSAAVFHRITGRIMFKGVGNT